jgi:hypothetical protein
MGEYEMTGHIDEPRPDDKPLEPTPPPLMGAPMQHFPQNDKEPIMGRMKAPPSAIKNLQQ